MKPALVTLTVSPIHSSIDLRFRSARNGRRASEPLICAPLSLRIARPLRLQISWSSACSDPNRAPLGDDAREPNPEDVFEIFLVHELPTLLIRGTADTNIPIRHSQELHAANPNLTELWAVPGAEHVASLSSDPAIYTTLVVNWFRSHACESLTREAPSKAQRR